MEVFIRFYAEHNPGHWALDIRHSSIVDWCITVGYKVSHEKHGETIIHVQDCDVDLAFAKAQVALKEWLCEHNGGY